jgi:hypothetical protein
MSNVLAAEAAADRVAVVLQAQTVVVEAREVPVEL